MVQTLPGCVLLYSGWLNAQVCSSICPGLGDMDIRGKLSHASVPVSLGLLGQGTLAGLGSLSCAYNSSGPEVSQIQPLL